MTSVAQTPGKVKLDAVDSDLFHDFAAAGLTWSEFAEEVLKDTPECIYMTSKEISVMYPAWFRCNEHCKLAEGYWDRCKNKVTAHQAAYENKHGPFSTGDMQSRTRCQEHVEHWTRPRLGAILQDASYNLGHVPVDHVPVELEEVHPQTKVTLQPIPTTVDEKKRREVSVRIEDRLLLSMWAEVQLCGEAKTTSWEWKVTSCRGNLQSHPSGNGRVQARYLPDAPSSSRLEVYDNHGAVITLHLTRALDLLGTLRSGF